MAQPLKLPQSDSGGINIITFYQYHQLFEFLKQTIRACHCMGGHDQLGPRAKLGAWAPWPQPRTATGVSYTEIKKKGKGKVEHLL